ncbi:MAG TPA: hypothetical protein VF461_17675 [Gemmatimonadaceae bacterium]
MPVALLFRTVRGTFDVTPTTALTLVGGVTKDGALGGGGGETSTSMYPASVTVPEVAVKFTLPMPPVLPVPNGTVNVWDAPGARGEVELE